MICKNCEVSFEGNYCNNCGQKAITGRLTYKEVITNFVDSFNLETGILLTLKLLFVNPKKILTEYLQGKRKTYYNPVKFFLIALSFNIFIVTLFAGKKTEGIDMMNSPLFLIGQVLILLPTLTTFTYFLTKKRISFVENLVVNLYALGVYTIISVFTFFLRKAFRDLAIIESSNFSFFLLTFLALFVPVFIVSWYQFKATGRNFLVLFLTIGLIAFPISVALMFLLFQLIGIVDFSSSLN